MRTYAIPEPTPLERQLARLISGSTRQYADWKNWPNGEVFVRVRDVRDEVCVIGRTNPSEQLWRTLLLVDTLRRTGAERITVVLPYFAYSRQDRSIEHGDALSSGTVSRLLASAGASRIVTADLHSGMSAEESPIPLESVSVLPEFAALLRRDIRGECTVVSPDAGGRARASVFAEALARGSGSDSRHIGIAWVEKRRNPRTGAVRMLGVDGEFVGDTAIIVDDMVDTGGTVLRAAELLRKKGMKKLFLCATHPILSGSSARAIFAAGFAKIYLSDTVPGGAKLPRSVVTISAAERLAGMVKL